MSFVVPNASVGLIRVFRCLQELHTHTNTHTRAYGHSAPGHARQEAENKEPDGDVLRSNENAGFCAASTNRVK